MRWWAAGWCLAFEKCFIGGEDVVWTGCDLLGIAVWSSSAKAKAEFFIRCSKLWWVCCDTCTHLLSWGDGRILKFYMNMGLRAVDSLWLNCCEHLESSPSMWVVRGHRYMHMHGAGSWNAKAFLQRERIPVQPRLVIASQYLWSNSLLKPISLKSEIPW